MNALIEVAAAEATSLMAVPSIVVLVTAPNRVARLNHQVAATSFLRALFQGRTSQSAVSPDAQTIYEGGLAVA